MFNGQRYGVLPCLRKGQIPPTLHRFDHSIDLSSARNADDECIK
jgi:hypothetical protein